MLTRCSPTTVHSWNDEHVHFPEAEKAEVRSRVDMITERAAAEEEEAMGATFRRLEERRRGMEKGRERERGREGKREPEGTRG